MDKPKFKLAPPHGGCIYWERYIPGDSRVEEVRASRAWFWRGMNQEEASR